MLRVGCLPSPAAGSRGRAFSCALALAGADPQSERRGQAPVRECANSWEILSPENMSERPDHGGRGVEIGKMRGRLHSRIPFRSAI